MDRRLQHKLTITIHDALTRSDLAPAQREKLAAMARRFADRFKRWDGSFSYEWFYGACGLDHWGEVIEFESLELQ